MVHYALLRTALDPLLAMAGDEGLVWLEFLPDSCAYHTKAHAVARTLWDTGPDHESMAIRESTDHFDPLRDQLATYFTGQTESFDLEIDLHGTDFQKEVWNELLKIPYGKLRTYGEIAVALNKPKATRAVGQAAGHNPLPIIVPCHRVIGKTGALVGFAGGITTKARLLRLEGHTLDSSSHLEEPRLF
jgi:O-6-methylguanine DNA methyltransferase